MTDPQPPGEVTQLLAKLGDDAEGVSSKVFEMVYARLRQQASRLMGAGLGKTLQPTALVHEAWMKMDGNLEGIRDRQHFFGVAGLAMRQILSDRARRARALKRDGGQRDHSSSLEAAAPELEDELIALDDALTKLHSLNARHAQVATLRFLGGLTIEETAEVVGVSGNTVITDWAMARAWLKAEIER